jgi:flavin reductase (DIM6/NTAB) family NADH-FMN oxidoreductase RutF
MTQLEVFESLAAELDPPMYIVTATARGEHSGCLVGFAGQTSIEPLRFTVWLSVKNRTEHIAAHAEALVVHVLRDGDEGLAAHFGGQTGDEVDKFAGIPWEEGPDGTPVLGGCDWFGGRILERIDCGGDHRGYVLEPFTGERRHRSLPSLGFQRVRGMKAGHKP